MKSPSEIIRACFAAYESKDRAALEALLAADFTFSSPLDDRISRERYMERCWPNSEHIKAVHIERLFVQGNEAFVRYRIESTKEADFHNTEFFTVEGDKIKSVEVYFGAEEKEASGEAEVREVVEVWAEAVRRRDVSGVLTHFAEESVRFFLAPPLQADTPLKENLEEWFATFSGPIGYELRNLKITASGELAYGHSLLRISGTKTDGQRADLWSRLTLCLQKREDRWRITHAHESVPFYMEQSADGGFRAAVDLQP